jgi:hypothetical protein
MTWSICRMCSFGPSFTSRRQICDWTSIRWIAVKEGDISAGLCGFSIATQQILVQSRMWEREGKESLKLHNLCTDHVTIRSELRYIIGAKIVDLKCRVFGGNQLQRSTAGSEPDPALDREFGSFGNTRWRIAVDMRNMGDNLLDWVGRPCNRCNYTADRDLYLSYQGWYNDSHMKCS